VEMRWKKRSAGEGAEDALDAKILVECVGHG
jgi:hypothetical protein